MGNLPTMATYRDPEGNPTPAAPEGWIAHCDARGVWWVRLGHRNHRVTLDQLGDGSWDIRLDGASDRWVVHGLREQLMERMGLEETDAAGSKELRAPMPGKVLEVLVEPGQPVVEGDPMLVLEAMKMENVLRAGGEGSIGSILVAPGEAVEKDAVLIALAD